jgi:hypothetical protein
MERGSATWSPGQQRNVSQHRASTAQEWRTYAEKERSMSHSEQFDAEDESTPVQPELALFARVQAFGDRLHLKRKNRSKQTDARGLLSRFQENRWACLELRNVEGKASSESARKRFKRSFN